jgi:hypothetical protein
MLQISIEFLRNREIFGGYFPRSGTSFSTQRRKDAKAQGALKASAEVLKPHRLVNARRRSGLKKKFLCFLRDFAPWRLCVEFN